MTSYVISKTGPCYVQYGTFLYIVYVTCSRMNVLYSHYRVNRGTNMYVIFCFVTLYSLFCFHCVGDLCCAFSNFGMHSPACILLYNN